MESSHPSNETYSLNKEELGNTSSSPRASGIEITEARGDEDVFPSSSLLREYVSLEGCELATRGLLKMP